MKNTLNHDITTINTVDLKKVVSLINSAVVEKYNEKYKHKVFSMDQDLLTACLNNFIVNNDIQIALSDIVKSKFIGGSMLLSKCIKKHNDDKLDKTHEDYYKNPYNSYTNTLLALEYNVNKYITEDRIRNYLNENFSSYPLIVIHNAIHDYKNAILNASDLDISSNKINISMMFKSANLYSEYLQILSKYFAIAKIDCFQTLPCIKQNIESITI